jgi:2-methylisocitrate lyase-like PEP mutase family enzyme
VTVAERAEAFRALHERPGAFPIPNPWDAGSARILAGLGFEALATTSGGLAYSLGRRDAQGLVTRDEALAHAAAIVEATPLPVSADLENGFGDDPETVAETIGLAGAVGLAGASIEDATTRPDDPIHPLGLAVERVAAAVEAARALPFAFVLTARAENHLYGRDDLADTIARLQAYEEAGADVLYAPALRTLDEVRAVCSSVAKPVNVLAWRGLGDLDALAEAGATRVSVGSGLAIAAYTGFLRAARELREQGTFGYWETNAGGDVAAFMQGR